MMSVAHVGCGQVVGGDPDKDVAVLQLLDMPPEKARELKPVQLGTSSTLLVGQRVYAIGAHYCFLVNMQSASTWPGASAGTAPLECVARLASVCVSCLLTGHSLKSGTGNPFGLDHTLTQGIVSGVGRELQTPGMHHCKLAPAAAKDPST